jgi:hypothetical protein
MLPGLATVLENALVGATSFLQGVRQNGEQVKRSVGENGRSQPGHDRRNPSRVEKHGPKGIAEDAPQESGLIGEFRTVVAIGVGSVCCPG